MADYEQQTFEFTAKKTIKGYPELHWTGKRPFKSTVYYPAQLKESYGEGKPFTDKDGKTSTWLNKIFWGDNLQVMSHLLRDFRGKVDLIYIDPPFDSKADYKKKIQLKGQTVLNDTSVFEEKQYGDIWTNDEYLQFMFERLILIKELLSPSGNIFLHCDWHKSHYLRLIMDEVFGANNFVNEIIWKRKGGSANPTKQLDVATDTLLWYRASERSKFFAQFSKNSPETQQYIEERFNNTDENGRRYMKSPIVSPNRRENLIYEYKGYTPPPNGWSISRELMEKWDTEGKLYFPKDGGRIYRKIYLDEYPGQPISSIWTDIYVINPMALERVDYPTQKPESLLERVLSLTTESDDLVFDCFMGSGTTQAVAMKLGRRFIGADINLGAVQTTTKRLLKIAAETAAPSLIDDKTIYTGFEVFNVNNYEIFRNPLEARSILLQALEVEPYESSSVYDGEKDGRMVKIMPADVNRIATKADLNGFIANLPYKVFERRKEENPNEPVLKLTVICMGHEPDLAAEIKRSLLSYKIDVEVVDILTDRKDLQFKRDAQGEVSIEGGKLVIKNFYPLNLMQKLSMQRENVDEWRQLVESVMVDFNYDGAVLSPMVIDTPDRNELVKGVYEIPASAGKIKIKITDLLSESLEIEMEVK